MKMASVIVIIRRKPKSNLLRIQQFLYEKLMFDILNISTTTTSSVHKCVFINRVVVNLELFIHIAESRN